MNILRHKKTVFLSIILAMIFVRTASGQDFNFSLEPKSLTLVPGQQASFIVSLTPIAGFTNQVTLSTTTLPDGVTASFSPTTVNLPGTSILNLSATTNATTGDFTLDITATGGGKTHVSSTSVSVSFGLLPICYGAFQGTVRDAITGNPLQGVSVNAGNYYTSSDVNGFYSLTNLPLAGQENLPASYGVQAVSNGYYASTIYSYAVCDATNTVDFQIIPIETGSISGTVITTGGIPVTNATVIATSAYPNFATTDSNGVYQFPALSLQTGNIPTYYSMQANPGSGYWYTASNTIVQANSNSVVNFIVVPVCYQTVFGRVVYSNTGLPATNITVNTYSTDPGTGFSENLYTITDADGNYTFTNVTLGYQNISRQTTVFATATGYYQGTTNVMISDCPVAEVPPGQPGGPIDAGTILLNPIPPPPGNNYGNLTGYIYDIETGLPLTNASVYVYGVYNTFSDSNGFYIMTNLFVGAGQVTNSYNSVFASANNYFLNSSNLILYANENNTQDIYLLKIGYGGVEGTVYDAQTGLPVLGAYVSLSSQTTHTDGHYASGPLELSVGNLPTYESYYVQKNGYWQINTNTYITNGITNIVDIQLIPICKGATVVGNVINALTQQPLTNATVSTFSGGSYITVPTDTNGDFIITNLVVGNDNSPIQSTLTASAPGFNQQSKTVTIFCDAVISTTFGAPETNFGTIQGIVTNVLTGQAISNVFIGSSFGGATTTDTNGFYILNQVPLSANSSNKTWTVTAIPSDFPAQTKSVTVSANTTNELDFGFGQPLTELVISATGTPNPVNVGNSLTYSITLTNLKADATNVVLTDTLPFGVTFDSASITNNPGGFGIPVESNGVVTVTGFNLSSNAGVVLLITVTPSTAGGLTNIVTVTSDTPDVAPGSSNHTAQVIGAAVAPSNFADLGVTMTGNPNPVLVNNQLTYTVVVTNIGPATAPSVSLVDTLPGNSTFGSITVSQGTYNLSTGSIQWSIGTMPSSTSVTATIVVQPTVAGEVENTATVSIGSTENPVTDPNPENNDESVFTTVTSPTVNGSIQYGDITFNPQTGLFEQFVTYFNQQQGQGGQIEKLGGPEFPPVNAIRIFVLGLPSSIQLYNATGTSNGVPYVEYDSTVPSGSSVSLLLQYYEGSRLPFTSTNFQVTATVAVTVPPTSGTYLQIDRPVFYTQGGNQLVIEFATVPGHTYEIQYSSDMKTWAASVPQIVARNTRTDWVDEGPPGTTTPPSLGGRFYRIVEIK